MVSGDLLHLARQAGPATRRGDRSQVAAVGSGSVQSCTGIGIRSRGVDRLADREGRCGTPLLRAGRSGSARRRVSGCASRRGRGGHGAVGAPLGAAPRWPLLAVPGKHAVRVRRRLPNRQAQPSRPTDLPIRILLVSPRPEKDDKGNAIGYIDHRVSARPLTEAVESLGDLAQLTILQPPTYAALEKALQDAADPFDVVHFDGHGVYDRRIGLDGLCFEAAGQDDKLDRRTMDFVDATKLAGLVREHRIPLVFLEACQTAVAEIDPTASVAARLLDEGVTSVVAMSHSVLVETARLFVQAFYAELATGA